MRLQHSQKHSTEKSIRLKSRIFDPEFKKKVALFAENKGNQEAKRRFGVSESNIRRWKKIQKEHVFEKAAVRNAGIKKNSKKRNSIVEDVPNRIGMINIDITSYDPIRSHSKQRNDVHFPFSS